MISIKTVTWLVTLSEHKFAAVGLNKTRIHSYLTVGCTGRLVGEGLDILPSHFDNSFYFGRSQDFSFWNAISRYHGN